jgi:hypothetical protein
LDREYLETEVADICLAWLADPFYELLVIVSAKQGLSNTTRIDIVDGYICQSQLRGDGYDIAEDLPLLFCIELDANTREQRPAR